ncbi:MAG: hypothetical protein RIQ56_509, partial [Candidatus Parcubacteria bacterium]
MVWAAFIESGAVYALLFISLYFEIFLLLSFLERQTVAKRTSFSEDQTLPSVAIAVPCHNEEKTLAKTISSLLALSYPKDKLEIFIIDDGSTDGTFSVANSFSDQRIRVFRTENHGKHAALNLALQQTEAELIGCLDADSEVKSDALMRAIEVFRNSNV